MTSTPIGRTRATDGITRLRASLTRVWPVGLRSLAVCVLCISTIACAPSRPIAPVRAPSANSLGDPVFDARQLERLERLRRALAATHSARSSSDEGGLSIRLAFDDAADLDVFVTDPLQEAVYFANSPTRTGGTLLADRRCDDPSPRIEIVRYERPIPGRYRVGVDFHRRCPDTQLSGSEEKQGLYIVQVDDGARVLERAGMATLGHFEVIVIEFDVNE